METRPYTQKDKNFKTSKSALLNSLLEYRRMEITAATGSTPRFDVYTTEIDLIADVLTYVKIAYRRFADMIPMLVEQKFLSPLPLMLTTELMAAFITGEGSEERCKLLLEDSPEVIARRKEILGKLAIVEPAATELKKFKPS